MIKLILASGSPRRSELLKLKNIDFEIIKAVGEEVTDKTLPDEIVMDLARNKAMEVYNKIKNEMSEEDFQVLGADTIVAFNGEILGKPVNRDDAFRMIKMIVGNKHQVYTGVAIVKQINGKMHLISFADRTDVFVKNMTDSEINAYVATGESDDKAGAYGIQGIFGKYIDHIEGDMNNVIGLPVDRVIDNL